jgi:FdhD protein
MSKKDQTLSYLKYRRGQWVETKSPVPREWPLHITLNGIDLVTLLCTPTKLNALVLGFLFLERIVDGIDQVTMIRVCPDETRCEVRVHEPRINSLRRTITSGCGGGTTFSAEAGLTRVKSTVRVSPVELSEAMKALMESAQAYKETGGIHTSALANRQQLLVMAEDVGRHNTIDKIAGECLIEDIPTPDRLLVTTGRISSEMLLKAARLEVPIVASHTSPTDLAVKLAKDLGITLVGYVRGGAMNVYSAPERIRLDS